MSRSVFSATVCATARSVAVIIDNKVWSGARVLLCKCVWVCVSNNLGSKWVDVYLYVSAAVGNFG